jgi:hypothetical protein
VVGLHHNLIRLQERQELLCALTSRRIASGGGLDLDGCTGGVGGIVGRELRREVGREGRDLRGSRSGVLLHGSNVGILGLFPKVCQCQNS